LAIGWAINTLNAKIEKYDIRNIEWLRTLIIASWWSWLSFTPILKQNSGLLKLVF
jgi:hypothetical protein